MNNPIGSFAIEGTYCPYLGMKQDASTSLGYPSRANLCYQCRSLDVPGLEHQRTYCLTRKHELCPVFSERSNFGLPKEARLQDQADLNKKSFWIVFLALGVISVGGMILFSQLADGRKALPVPVTTPTVQAGSNPADLVVPTTTQTKILPTEPGPATTNPGISISTPHVTGTKSVAMHTLDEPIGIAHRFIIHRILQGESLFTLASSHNTNVEAIKYININMPDPVWVDWPVIIPLDTTDVSGMPVFETYQEMGGGISIEELAENLNRAVSDLKYYNGLEAGYLVSKGEWLLIPTSVQ